MATAARVCLHADDDGRGAHVLEPGQRCRPVEADAGEQDRPAAANAALVAELHRVAELIESLPDLPPLAVYGHQHAPGAASVAIQVCGAVTVPEPVRVAAVDALAEALCLPPAVRHPTGGGPGLLYEAQDDTRRSAVYTPVEPAAEPAVELEPAR